MKKVYSKGVERKLRDIVYTVYKFVSARDAWLFGTGTQRSSVITIRHFTSESKLEFESRCKPENLSNSEVGLLWGKLS